MKSGHASAWTLRSKTSSTAFCERNSAVKKPLSFLACRIWMALEIINDQAMTEKMMRQKMMTLASGVACLQIYTSSSWLEPAANKIGTFIPARYLPANLVVRNRSAQAEYQKIDVFCRFRESTGLFLTTFRKKAKTFLKENVPDFSAACLAAYR